MLKVALLICNLDMCRLLRHLYRALSLEHSGLYAVST